MNIYIEANSLLEKLTGIGTYTYNLIKSLTEINSTDSKDIKYYLFLDNATIAKNCDITLKNCGIIFYGKRRKYLFFKDRNLDNILNYIFYIRKLKKNIDIFHTTSYEIPYFIRKDSFKCKKIVTVYDLSFVLYPDFFTKKSIARTQEKYFSAKESDCIITISNSSKLDIINNWNIAENKIKVIYPGVNKNIFNSDQNKNEEILNKHGINYRYILFVGTLEPRKNLCRLIEAFKIVNSKYKDIKLVIVGKEGWLYEPIFQKIKNLELENNILHIGYVDIKELPYFYKNASVFVYPSIYEGFGFPPLEAMACGCPVITSNTSSLPEVVGDAGILVDPYNIEEIAEAINRVLIDDDLRNELIKKGLNRAKQFSWEKTARETLKTYKDVS